MEVLINLNKELWDKFAQFHGHECPGLAIGFKAAEAAMAKKYVWIASRSILEDFE